MVELGANLLARLAVGPRRGFQAFLQGRLGWSRLAATVNRLDLTQDGIVVGPEVGIEVPIGIGHIVLGAGGTWNSYGNTRAGTGVVTFLDTGGSGFQYGARAGVLLGL